jgi:hypothetical protein
MQQSQDISSARAVYTAPPRSASLMETTKEHGSCPSTLPRRSSRYQVRSIALGRSCAGAWWPGRQGGRGSRPQDHPCAYPGCEEGGAEGDCNGKMHQRPHRDLHLHHITQLAISISVPLLKCRWVQAGTLDAAAPVLTGPAEDGGAGASCSSGILAVCSTWRQPASSMSSPTQLPPTTHVGQARASMTCWCWHRAAACLWSEDGERHQGAEEAEADKVGGALAHAKVDQDQLQLPAHADAQAGSLFCHVRKAPQGSNGWLQICWPAATRAPPERIWCQGSCIPCQGECTCCWILLCTTMVTHPL